MATSTRLFRICYSAAHTMPAKKKFGASRRNTGGKGKRSPQASADGTAPSPSAPGESPPAQASADSNNPNLMSGFEPPSPSGPAVPCHKPPASPTEATAHGPMVVHVGPSVGLMEAGPGMGRRLVATAHIEAGEVVLDERPLLAAPLAAGPQGRVHAFCEAAPDIQAKVLDLHVPPEDDPSRLVQDARALARLICKQERWARGWDARALSRVACAWQLHAHAFGDGAALFELGSCVAHACDGNCTRTSHRTGCAGRLCHVALRPIAPGEAITDSHLGGGCLWSTPRRREKLAAEKLLHCTCPRCTGEDRTRALPCPRCHPRAGGRRVYTGAEACEHYALPTDGRDEWVCGRCGGVWDADAVLPRGAGEERALETGTLAFAATLAEDPSIDSDDVQWLSRVPGTLGGRHWASVMCVRWCAEHALAKRSTRLPPDAVALLGLIFDFCAQAELFVELTAFAGVFDRAADLLTDDAGCTDPDVLWHALACSAVMWGVHRNPATHRRMQRLLGCWAAGDGAGGASHPTAEDALSTAGRTLFGRARSEEGARAQAQYRRALLCYRAARLSSPKDHRVHSNVAATLQKLGRHAEAVAAARVCIRHAPSFAKGHYRLAVSLLALGEVAEAEAAASRATQLGPGEDGDLRALLARVREARGAAPDGTGGDPDRALGSGEGPVSDGAGAASQGQGGGEIEVRNFSPFSAIFRKFPAIFRNWIRPPQTAIPPPPPCQGPVARVSRPTRSPSPAQSATSAPATTAPDPSPECLQTVPWVGAHVSVRGGAPADRPDGCRGVVRGRSGRGRYRIRTFSAAPRVLSVSPERVAVTAPAAEVRVCPATLAQALAGARPGATLLLQNGVYAGPLKLRQEVRLAGQGPGTVVQSASGVAAVHVCAAAAVVLSGLAVRNGARGPCASALLVDCGSVTADECSFVSAGGPGVAAVQPRAALFLHRCEIRDCAGGGLLVGQGATAAGAGVRIADCGAAGVEVRDGGTLELEDSVMAGNKRQGLSVWCTARRARLAGCEIVDHTLESGVLCSDGHLTMTRCRVHRNRMGVAVQGGGAVVQSCAVYGNAMEGLMLQGKGRATVAGSDVHSNGGHGIFVGYDAAREITLQGNHVHGNQGEGIFNGAPRSKKVTMTGNTQSSNRGFPASAQTLLGAAAASGGDLGAAVSRAQRAMGVSQADALRHAKAVNRAGGAAAVADAHGAGAESAAALREVVDATALGVRACAACGAQERLPDAKLKACTRCQRVVYCSKACQKGAWKAHKKVCQPHVAFPAAADPDRDVHEMEAGPGPDDFEDVLTHIARGLQDDDPRAAVAKAELLMQAGDYQAACRVLTAPAEAGDGEAQCTLGYLSEQGWGVPRDLGEAQRWYRRASAAGSAAAMARLGNLLRRRATPDDEAMAVEWWEKARRADPAVDECVPELRGSDPVSVRDTEASADGGACDARCHACGRGESPPDVRLFRCSRCKRVLYCSKECQKSDWKAHKTRCTEACQGGLKLERVERFLRDHAAAPRACPHSVGNDDARQVRVKAMLEAVERDPEGGMRECARHLQATSTNLAFLQHLSQGEMDEACRALAETLHLDDTAMFMPPAKQPRVLAHARQMLHSGAPAVRAVGLFVAGLLLGPVDGVPHLLQLSREPPTFPPAGMVRVWDILASMYGFLDRWGDTIRCSEKALALDPQFYWAHYVVGVAHKQQCNLPEAIRRLDLYLQGCPPDARKLPHAHYALAWCHCMQGDRQVARRCYEAGREAEQRLRTFWGPCETEDKGFLGTIDWSNVDLVHEPLDSKDLETGQVRVEVWKE